MLDEKLAHGTPFSRAVEEDIFDEKRVVQIGLRGTLYSHDDLNFAKKQVKEVSSCKIVYSRPLSKQFESIQGMFGSEINILNRVFGWCELRNAGINLSHLLWKKLENKWEMAQCTWHFVLMLLTQHLPLEQVSEFWQVSYSSVTCRIDKRQSLLDL